MIGNVAPAAATGIGGKGKAKPAQGAQPGLSHQGGIQIAVQTGPFGQRSQVVAVEIAIDIGLAHRQVAAQQQAPGKAVLPDMQGGGRAGLTALRHQGAAIGQRNRDAAMADTGSQRQHQPGPARYARQPQSILGRLQQQAMAGLARLGAMEMGDGVDGGIHGCFRSAVQRGLPFGVSFAHSTGSLVFFSLCFCRRKRRGAAAWSSGRRPRPCARVAAPPSGCRP